MIRKEDLLKAMSDIDDKYIKEILDEDGVSEENESSAEEAGTSKQPESSKVTAFESASDTSAAKRRKKRRYRQTIISAAAIAACLIAFASLRIFNGGSLQTTSTLDTAEVAGSADSSVFEGDLSEGQIVDGALGAESAQEDGQENSQSKAQGDGMSGASEEEMGGDMIPNPFEEVSTLEEAADIAGFTFTVPDSLEEGYDITIRVMKDSMIEVLFFTGEDESFRIRKATGEEDVSGDYNSYQIETTMSVGDTTVTLKGNKEEEWNVVTWTKDGYSYAIDAGSETMTSERAETIVSEVD